MYQLPLFPLHTVLFPGMPIHLHIFEPRYREMMRLCLDDQRPFGVVLIRQGMEALGPLADPFPVGTTAHITEVATLPDGRMNLVALGDERFRILSLDRSHTYLTAQVESLPLDTAHTLQVARGGHLLRKYLAHYIRLLARTGLRDLMELNQLEMPDDPMFLTYLAAALLQLPAVEKQALLEDVCGQDLQAHVLRLYSREIPLLARLLGIEERRAERAAWLN